MNLSAVRLQTEGVPGAGGFYRLQTAPVHLDIFQVQSTTGRSKSAARSGRFRRPRLARAAGREAAL